MPGIQETEFQEHFDAAKFTEEEAAKAFSANGEMVSLVARRGTPDVFVVSFSNRQNKKFGPIVLNRVTASMLRGLLAQEGF